ncbi:hypothetical protein XFF6166_1020053 [Xanthomonas citri pv. fuscans]|nr:hypothetical protein XFF6166_1020053 [Xanthomonas citri pv. fuscans]SOO03303.1 hypothetical protein XFF6960_840055 [Xanthomonas citri pv. fuscans]SOO07358.1 hypothetical protein XFF7767_960055 [Xanthomonas citri pv. fuscans]SOO11945.1 hypothetical protein XFF6970_990054 [Xanthomonas citri pv. fuscans]SOO12296.1 hypothetical protein XFF7766_1060055 [Xanthomonas citri pv. fuscans]
MSMAEAVTLALRAANKRSEQLSGGRGRRAQNRSVRLVHEDSEHRPRPPGGCAVVLLAALNRSLPAWPMACLDRCAAPLIVVPAELHPRALPS